MKRKTTTSGRRTPGGRGKGSESSRATVPDTIPAASGFDRVPGWVAPVFFAVLTVYLFRAFIFSNDMLFGSDTLSLGYQARAFFANALRETGFPLWNPYILGGTPLLESLIGGDALHPISVALFFLMEPYRALGWKLVIHVFLAGLFMFGWLRALGCSRGAALVGGTGALLAPSFVTLVFPGHDGKMFVVAMTPLLFWLSEWMWRRKDLVPGALLALSIGLTLFSTHFQMAYFLFGALGIWMLFRAIQEGRRNGWKVGAKGYAVFLAFSLLGTGTAAIQLLPAVGYLTEHSRRTATTTAAASPEAARAWSSSFSLHPEEAVSLVVPEFIGSSIGGPSVGGAAWTDDTYWGRNGFKLNHEYLGAVLLALALLAFLKDPRATPRTLPEEERPPPSRSPETSHRGRTPPPMSTRWFLAGLGIVAALFALGAHTPVWRLLYEFLPGISLFRAPSMAIFLTAFVVCTLAAMGLDRAAELLGGAEGRRKLLLWSGGFAGLLLVGGIFASTGLLLDFWGAVIHRNPTLGATAAVATLQPHMIIGFFAVAVLVGALAAALWAAGRGALSAPILLAIVTGLVVVDLVRVNAPFVRTTDPARVTVPDPNIRFLQDRARVEPPFRVLSMVGGQGQDVHPSAFGIELVSGHHPNDLHRYRELIGMEGSGIPEHLFAFDPVVLAMLNVRYILWPDAQFGPIEQYLGGPEAEIGSIEGLDPLNRTQFSDGEIWGTVYPYPGFPRARLVGRYRTVSPGGAISIILEDNTFDPRLETILEEAPLFEPAPNPIGGAYPSDAIRWIEREPDRLLLEVESDAPTLLVVSQNWFPSWVARVNGEETPVLRADHALLAVAIPAGRHEVELVVESRELRQALLLSGLSFLTILGVGLASGLVARRAGAGGRRAGEADA